MADDTTEPAEIIGGNAQAMLESFARRISDGLDLVAEGREAVKAAKEEAKAEGYTVKALSQCVKELRKGAKHSVDQLQLELELTTYRKALGLPADLESAQKLAAQEAESVPEGKPRRGKADNDDSGPDDDGEKHTRKRAPRKDLN